MPVFSEIDYTLEFHLGETWVVESPDLGRVQEDFIFGGWS